MTAPRGDMAVQLSHVFFSYNGHQVLEDVSLEVAAGDFVALVGPNGGGKTTLLKVILGLLRPQEGAVTVLGQSPKKAHHMVGYVPQHAELDVRFPITVLEVVMTGLLTPGAGMGPWGRSRRGLATQALERVDAADLAALPFAELSGGQHQRVLLARALVSRPRLLILDEPTAAVDPGGEAKIMELLAAMRPQVTVLMATHDIGFVSAYVSQVACVNRQVVMHPTQEVTSGLIDGLYGRPVRMVRHDRESHGGAGCLHD